MPLSTAAKAALCLCPPTVMAGTVATVPSVKRAVHHLTAAHHPAKPVHRLATAAAQPPVQPERQADCGPVAAGAVPAVPLVTYAAPIPDEPGGRETGSGIGPAVAAAGPTAAALAVSTPAPAPADTLPASPGPVPEPATWLMLILGAGAIGATLRRRHVTRPGARRAGLGAQATVGATLWSTSAAVEAGEVATTVAAKSMMASAAGKALLCVCPAAVVAGSVVAVPPLRQAVHASTAMPAPATTPAGLGRTVVPCDPPVAGSVPVSATSVKGFPDIVSTVARES